jgi:hypothetical protein
MVVIFAMCKCCTERCSGVNSIFVPCSKGLEFKSRPREQAVIHEASRTFPRTLQANDTYTTSKYVMPYLYLFQQMHFPQYNTNSVSIIKTLETFKNSYMFRS